MGISVSSFAIKGCLCQRCKGYLEKVSHVGKPKHYIVNGSAISNHGTEIEADSRTHWNHFRELENAAKKRCPFCVLFLRQVDPSSLNQLRAYQPRSPSDTGKIQLMESTLRDLGLFCLVAEYPLFKLGTPSLERLVLHLEPIDDSRANLSRRYISTETGPVWKKILSWIDQCDTGHNRCLNPNGVIRSPRLLPRRLVFVGSSPDFTDVHLCETNGLDVDITRYTTLSHCWGVDGLEFKLVQSNIHQFLEKIPFCEMPLTFRDAIKATRALCSRGVRYIWIDALCIIQDLRPDWDRECQIMGDIYSHSFVNLAACRGENSHGGLLSPPENDIFHSCLLRIPKSRPLPMGQYEVSIGRDYLISVERSALVRRCWVMQELLLARRILYFTPHQVFWECCTSLYAEVRANSCLSSTASNRGFWKARSFDNARLWHESLTPAERDAEIYMIWTHLVVMFSGCELSKKGDLFPAIAGVAKQMQRLLEGRDSYVCGMWRSQLPYHLGWKVTEGHQSTRPRNDGERNNVGHASIRAPTWSWASVEGLIKPSRFGNTTPGVEPLCEVEIHDVQYWGQTPNAFGQVESSRLRVTGYLVAVELRWETTSGSAAGTISSKKPSLSYPGRNTQEEHEVFLDLITDLDQPLKAYCLPILEEHLFFMINIVYLVLIKKNSERGEYERCGMVEETVKYGKSLLRAARNAAETDVLETHDDSRVSIFIS